MRTLEAIVDELVEVWVTKAEMDYMGATRMAADPDPLRELIAFHCQQSAEKYLKAYLTQRQIEFPKTHRIAALLQLIAPVAPELAASLAQVDALSPYGVETRYPSDFPNLLPGKERELLALAAQTREAIRAELRR